MFQKIVEKILSPILSEYVEDFNAQNMKIGLWSGEVVIKNVRLRKQIIKKLNLPFKLKYSRLGILKMNIPWKSLSSSKIDIVIEGLQLLITQIPQNQWSCKNNKIIEQRKQQIISYCESIIQDFVKKSANASKEDEEKGYFGNIVSRIIDNVQVTIKDIHVRYQDELTQKYSFGVTLEQLKVFTVNKQGEPQFIDRTKKQYQNQPLRKKLILSNFGLYWNEKSQFYQDPQPHDAMITSIAKNNQPSNPKMNYLILMSSNAELYQRQPGKQYAQPEINLFIQFEQLKVKISNQQLQQIITMSERLQSYMNQVKAQNRKKLTQQQMKSNYQQFFKLFPAFIDKKSTPQQLSRIQDIIQKMQIQNFQQGMKTYLQTKQKQKLIQQKMDKKKGWFSFSKPKQLTQQQMKQIQDFVKNNFGLQTKIIKRPEQFYYIKVNFKLKLLNISIANTKTNLKNQEGISVDLQQIKFDFNLREGGYLLNFGMQNILVDLYNKPFDKSSVLNKTNILQKIQLGPGDKKLGQYATLKVIGNPLDKKNIDTQLILKTEELLIQFDPRILKIAKDFADIKINSKNTEAAFQAYGQIKNKVTVAASQAADSISKTEKKKNFLLIDVSISTVHVMLFFNPLNVDGDIWVVNLGQTKIFSDAQTLKKPQFTQDQPIQKYCMSTTNMSVVHYQNKQTFFYSKTNNSLPNAKQIVLNELGVDFQIQMFKKSSDKRPSIRAKSTIHNLDLNLSGSTYPALQKIGDCFVVPVKVQTETKQQIQKIKANEKAQIMKQSKKIGVLYEQSGKQPKKFIGVLSGGYIYLYSDKKDIQYTNYYYVRNSKLSIQKEDDVLKKPFSLIIDNHVNKIKLGFDKQVSAQQWSKVIKAIQTKNQYLITQNVQQAKQQQVVKKQPVDPNNLNFQAIVAIERISINTMLYADRKANISINALTAHARIHQTKTAAKITLKQIKISDNIFGYKYKQLQSFLYSESIEGKQKLIDIDFEMISEKNPAYKQVDMIISMEIGKLVCNYKPQTVQNLMRFLLPKAQPIVPTSPISPKKLTAQDKKSSIQSHEQHIIPQEQIKKRKLQKQINLKSQPQKYKLKLNLKIKQISIALVNRKTRVMFSRVGLNNFKLLYGMSNKKMDIVGAISELWLSDYSNYPHTLIEEQQQYKQFKYIVQSYNKSRDMVTFDIQILQYHNQAGKNMIIKAGLYDLTASYIQQPVLRLITYLTDQMLPALTPSQDPNKPRVLIVNDTKPENPTMQLIVDLQNILAVVKPRTGQDQYLQLLVKSISVRNKSYQRPYIQNPVDQTQKVLVQHYQIKLNGISIIQKFDNKQNKLSNDMSIDLNCQLIQNTLYYKKTYGKRYDAGMRIKCKISPFLMRLNHDDYSFIMKCLNWNITYDDNADGYIFDPVVKQTQNKQIQAQSSQPMYCDVEMDRIILCVTQNNIPLSVLFLGGLNLKLNLDPTGMKMIFQMANLYGTHINSTQDSELSIQRGMFNLFGYQRKLKTKQLVDIQKLIDIYSIEQMAESIKSLNINLQKNSPVIFLQFESDKFSNTFINMKIQGLKIAIQLKNLLILSKLAITDNSIQPPKSTIKPALKKITQPTPPPTTTSGKTTINIILTDFMGSLSDKLNKNYIVMQGQFNIKLNMQGTKPQDQIISKGKNLGNGRFMNVSSHIIQLRNFSFYFCNINNLKNKRFILLPIKMYLVYAQQYGIKQDIVYLETDIDGQLDKIVIQCSVRDMLMINKILQDNLQTLTEYSTSPKKQQKQNMLMQQNNNKNVIQQNRQTQISSLKKKDVQIDKKAIQKTVKQMEKKIKDKMKAEIKLQPIQIRIVNDCNNNFMPVISFIIQQSNLLYSADPIKSHIAQSLTISFDFFNPRSAKWQPVIETFKLSLDYLTLMSEFGPKSQIIVSSTQIEQLRQLKINASTQLVSTLLATIQIAKNENKKMQAVQSINQIQVSPYIIQNKTNKLITVQRFITDQVTTIDLQPLFKGPVKLTDKAQQMTFYYQGKKYSVTLQKFGFVVIPGLDDIHLDFRMQKLNRVIVFVNYVVIKNSTLSQLYCIRYNQKKAPVQQKILIEPGQILPVQKDWFVQFSFNLHSFTYHNSILQLLQTNCIRSESKKFKLAITQKRVIMGHSIILIRAPFVIHNCLPKNLQIQYISNGKQLATKQITSQVTRQVFANQQTENLRFKILCQGFYWSQQFWADSSVAGKQCVLYLSDRENGGTTIKYIFEFDQKRGQFKLTIFCPAFIVSQLDCDLQVYANSDRQQANRGIQKYYKLGGQTQFWKKQTQTQHKKKIDKRILIGTQSGSKIRVCGKNCLIDFSQPIATKNIGVSQTRIVIQKQVHGKIVSLFTVLGVQVQLKKMSLKADIYSRQITLRSRWIFFNNSGFNLQIKQQGGDKFYYQIQRNQKKPFYFIVPQLKQKPKALIFRTQMSHQSVPVMVNGLGDLFFRLQSQTLANDYIHFKLSIQQIGSYLFYQITSVSYQNLPYQVIVKSQKLQVYVPQFQHQLRKDGYPLLFINQLPNQPYHLQLFVRLVGSSQHKQILAQADNLNFKQKIQFFEQGITQTFVMAIVYVIFNDNKKFIVIDQMFKDTQQLPQYQMQSIHFKLQRLSLSIIQNHSQQSSFQSFYFYMSNLQFIMQKTNKRTGYQVKLQFLQFDQQQPFNIPNPVVITPIKYKQFTSNDPKDKPKSIFNAFVSIDNSFVKNLVINQLAVQVNDLVVKIGSPFIKLIMDIYKQYTQAAKVQEQFLIKSQIDTWRSITPAPTGSKTFIKSIRIAPFMLNISAQIRFNELDQSSAVVFGSLLNALGVVITNIQDAPIVLDGIVLNDCNDSLQGLNQKLMEHYKNSVLGQLYKIFGSLNIIGNPVSLFMNISSGFKDLKEKPSQGFVQGPLEFGRGLAEGTSSLIAHSVGGALNSVSNVTGALASGLAALTFDKQFEERRQRQKMKKPKHVFEGLQKGGKAVFHGFKQGLTGLVLKPYQNAQKQGALGFFKGVAQGLTGVVVKPVTGVIDFASKTTEGLKNTALYLQDKPNQNRIRYPRVLYTQLAIVKQYDPIASKLLSIIKKPKYEQKLKVSNEPFMQYFKIEKNKFLVVLSLTIIFIKIDQQSIIWSVPLMSMKMEKYQQNAIKIEGPPKNNQFWQKSINELLNFQTKEEAEKFEKLIIDMKLNIGKYA